MVKINSLSFECCKFCICACRWGEGRSMGEKGVSMGRTGLKSTDQIGIQNREITTTDITDLTNTPLSFLVRTVSGGQMPNDRGTSHFKQTNLSFISCRVLRSLATRGHRGDQLANRIQVTCAISTYYYFQVISSLSQHSQICGFTSIAPFLCAQSVTNLLV
jgi:hypothetical protein